MAIAAMVIGFLVADLLAAILIGSFMRVGSNADTPLPKDFDDGAA